MKRILLKLSGEALGGAEGRGFESTVLETIASQLKEVTSRRIQVGVVIGGGNLFRGIQGLSTGLDRNSGDQMGMLATVMNAIALRGFLISKGVPARVLSAFPVGSFVEGYSAQKAQTALESGEVALLCGGTGNPFFTTDSAASLRAAEIGADLLVKATKVDGVYDKDPVQHKDAVRYDQLSFQSVLEKRLKIMDLTAITLCQENKISIRVVDLLDGNPISRLADGEDVGTLIS